MQGDADAVALGLCAGRGEVGRNGSAAVAPFNPAGAPARLWFSEMVIAPREFDRGSRAECCRHARRHHPGGSHLARPRNEPSRIPRRDGRLSASRPHGPHPSSEKRAEGALCGSAERRHVEGRGYEPRQRTPLLRRGGLDGVSRRELRPFFRKPLDLRYPRGGRPGDGLQGRCGYRIPEDADRRGTSASLAAVAQGRTGAGTAPVRRFRFRRAFEAGAEPRVEMLRGRLDRCKPNRCRNRGERQPTTSAAPDTWRIFRKRLTRRHQREAGSHIRIPSRQTAGAAMYSAKVESQGSSR